MNNDDAFKSRLIAARDLARAGRSREARAAFEVLHREQPASPEAATACARLALDAGDAAAAVTVLATAVAANRGHELLAVEYAVSLASVGGLAAALEVLERQVGQEPESPMAWLCLGEMLDDAGRAGESLAARFEALIRAQRRGAWLEPQTTPPHLVDAVARAVGCVRRNRREVFRHALASVRQEHGDAALARVEYALAGYLGEHEVTPSDPMQRPRFFYFPDLPATPFLDPMLPPWAGALKAAFPAIREEALSVLQEDAGLEDFVEVKPGDRIQNYLGGRAPSWEAFFFYRHGQRLEQNHRRCPRTSAVLESIDLCRIPGQTPEICFSVLAAGTHILPHFGVTNTRTVMHLPLVVPPDCALRLVERGEHRWHEGELVLFDDTYLHEAWNRSASARVILLMDCWNPHLTPAERAAVSCIAQTIGALDVSLAAKAWAHAQ